MKVYLVRVGFEDGAVIKAFDNCDTAEKFAVKLIRGSRDQGFTVHYWVDEHEVESSIGDET